MADTSTAGDAQGGDSTKRIPDAIKFYTGGGLYRNDEFTTWRSDVCGDDRRISDERSQQGRPIRGCANQSSDHRNTRLPRTTWQPESRSNYCSQSSEQTRSNRCLPDTTALTREACVRPDSVFVNRDQEVFPKRYGSVRFAEKRREEGRLPRFRQESASQSFHDSDTYEQFHNYGNSEVQHCRQPGNESARQYSENTGFFETTGIRENNANFHAQPAVKTEHSYDRPYSNTRDDINARRAQPSTSTQTNLNIQAPDWRRTRDRRQRDNLSDDESDDPRRNKQWIRPDKFNGRTCFETFMCKFENCSRYNGWDADDKVAHLRWSLVDNAAQLLWETEGMSYSQLVRRLRERFGSAGQEEKYQTELRCRRRIRNESTRELAQDIRRLMSLAYPTQNTLQETLSCLLSMILNWR